ncbi:MAG: 60 kDa inner membrane insertion protein [Parcubacteria group bacterium GW2011_GWA2_44_15]|nr:MAG: 60 kDa inner membrane insertion protein [Parcubacteria group bacterium GW2011_GWA2_44_15]
MISAAFDYFIYVPLYNGLVFLMDLVPWVDAGISVIIFTFLVKLILFPVSQKAVRTGLKMRMFEGDLAALKEKHKDDREAHAKATMAFYKEKNINPFSSIFLAFIQIPIILGLYFVFYSGGLPDIKTDLLYSFVSVPKVDMQFLGLIDITKGSAILALLVALSQYFQVKFSMPAMKPKVTGSSMKDDFARTLHLQMRYFLPVMVGVIAYNISGAVSLYWITSNLFAIGQEIYVRRSFL